MRLMLNVNNLNVLRGRIQVLWDISLTVGKSEIVSIIGANGAGKTTLLSTISGLLKPISGTITFNDVKIEKLPPHKIANMGISFVPEDRKLFPYLTVKENLILGAYNAKGGHVIKDRLNMVYEIFPILKEREKQLAVTLSGGEQRMLAIARGLMSNPSLLILDEPSQGLSPKVIDEIFRVIARLREHGISVLLAEQNVYYALKVANRTYVMETGRITIHGKSIELLENEYIKKAFLGL